MKSILKYILPFFVIVLLSCNDKKNNNNIVTYISNSDFTTESVLKPNSLKEINEAIFKPTFLDINDSLLLIVDDTEEEKLKFFSTSDHTLKGSYGNTGEGPDEISGPLFMVHSGLDEDEKVTMLDWGKKLLSQRSVQKKSAGDKSESNLTFLLPPELIKVQRAAFIDSNRVLGMGGIEQGKLFVHHISNDSTVFSPFIPNDPSFESKNTRGMGYIYFGHFVINNTLEKIAVVSRRFKRIEIYDFSLNLLSVTSFGKETDRTEVGENGSIRTDRTIYHYSDLDQTGQYIYALYHGEKGKQIYQTDEGESAEIHKFDWEGKPVEKITLKNSDIRFLSVDDKNNHIYGLNPSSAEVVLFKR